MALNEIVFAAQAQNSKLFQKINRIIRQLFTLDYTTCLFSVIIILIFAEKNYKNEKNISAFAN